MPPGSLSRVDESIMTGTGRTIQYPAVPPRPLPSYPFRCSNHSVAQTREPGPHTATPNKYVSPV